MSFQFLVKSIINLCILKKFTVRNWLFNSLQIAIRRSRPEVFLGKGVLKICSKFMGEHLRRSAISISKCNFKIALWHVFFTEIALRHGCSPVNLLYIFRNLFLRTSPDGCFWRMEKSGRIYPKIPKSLTIRSAVQQLCEKWITSIAIFQYFLNLLEVLF